MISLQSEYYMCCNQETQTYKFFPNIRSLVPNHPSTENGPLICMIGVSLACMFISLALEHRIVFSKRGCTLIIRLITILPKKFNLLLYRIFGGVTAYTMCLWQATSVYNYKIFLVLGQHDVIRNSYPATLHHLQ
jgi:hypothetical protein